MCAKWYGVHVLEELRAQKTLKEKKNILDRAIVNAGHSS